MLPSDQLLDLTHMCQKSESQVSVNNQTQTVSEEYLFPKHYFQNPYPWSPGSSGYLFINLKSWQ